MSLSGHDLAGDRGGCIHAGAAQTVDRRPGNLFRQSGEQGAHAGNITVVFTGLIGIAVNHIIDLLPVDRGVTLHQGADRYGAKIIRTYSGKGAAVTADGRADGIADIGIFHCSSLSLSPGIICPFMVWALPRKQATVSSASFFTTTS